MSLRKLYHLECDGCGREQRRDFATSRQARKVAREDGWRRVGQGRSRRGYEDLCYKCAAERKQGKGARQLVLEECG